MLSFEMPSPLLSGVGFPMEKPFPLLFCIYQTLEWKEKLEKSFNSSVPNVHFLNLYEILIFKT